MGKLTGTQADVLDAMAGGAVLYGPHGNGMGNQDSWGWSGASAYKPPRRVTCEKLLTGGLIERVQQKHPLGYYAITPEGRSALSAAKPTQGGESNG